MIRIVAKSALAALLLTLPISFVASTEAEEIGTVKQPVVEQKNKAPFTPFTGQVTKNRVRMRLNPSLDGPILRELEKNEMIVVIDEDDEYYAVTPPEDIKAFIFRTYVLDGTVEGHHVNVRLEPTLDSPVVAQLNTGDSVTGRISPTNSKWLEIVPPEGTRFYISKDYVEKVGNADYMAKIHKRRDEVNQLLDSAYMASQQDLQRPFDEIDYEATIDKFQTIIKNYPDFEQQVARSEELLQEFKSQYTKRKIAYLEAKSKNFIEAESLHKEHSRLSQAYRQQQQRLHDLEKQLGNKELPDTGRKIIGSVWLPQEEIVYEKWTEENGQRSMEEFYEDEISNAVTLRGMVQPYNRNVKNKPGDYILLNSNNTPIAFLYSTEVNLQDYVGREITLQGSGRPNNRFAYPAYHVLTVE